MELLVTGGYHDESGECFVDRVAPGRRERVLTFRPPAAHRIAGKGFTGATWLDGDLLVCTFDAVWRFAPGGRLIGRLHQPDFNDLHGVAVLLNGRLAVCNTGLDSVDQFDVDGMFIGRSGFTPGWFDARRQQGLAVAREALPGVMRAGWDEPSVPVMSAAQGPHYNPPGGEPFHRLRVRDYLHPNHAVEFDGRLAVTMLATREIRCARTFERLIDLPGNPHDGVVHEGRLLVTQTDGKVVSVGLDWSVEVAVDTARSGHTGWCRGLAVGPNALAVGLSEIRRTPQFSWRGDAFERTETSVLWFDVAGGFVGRVDLTDRDRQSKVFALLHPAKGWV